MKSSRRTERDPDDFDMRRFDCGTCIGAELTIVFLRLVPDPLVESQFPNSVSVPGRLDHIEESVEGRRVPENYPLTADRERLAQEIAVRVEYRQRLGVDLEDSQRVKGSQAPEETARDSREVIDSGM